MLREGMYRYARIVFPPGSQHICFAALAKNSHLWTVFTVLRTAASRPLHKGGKILSAIAELIIRKVRA